MILVVCATFIYYVKISAISHSYFDFLKSFLKLFPVISGHQIKLAIRRMPRYRLSHQARRRAGHDQLKLTSEAAV